MASYECKAEHNVVADSSPDERRVRPDLSTFFSNLEQVDTSNVQNPNARPMPVMMEALYRTGLDGMQEIMRTNPNRELPEQIIEFLTAQIETPPEQVRGVSDEFLADLERIPKKALKKSDECPICGLSFLDDQYPLVVRLPCNKRHMFDLECIQPWLKMNPTCPMDRKDFGKPKAPLKPPPVEEDDYDDMYA